MLDKVKLVNALSQSKHVILAKSASGPHPRSYSLVVRVEGDKVWRTPFEAETSDDVYDFEPGKYTMSKDLDHNPRVSIYSIVEPEINDDSRDDEDDYIDDGDDDCEGCDDCKKPETPRVASAPIAPAGYDTTRRLEKQIEELQHKLDMRDFNDSLKSLQQTAAPRKAWRKQVSV